MGSGRERLPPCREEPIKMRALASEASLVSGRPSVYEIAAIVE
jgi:hypothetical protein